MSFLAQRLCAFTAKRNFCAPKRAPLQLQRGFQRQHVGHGTKARDRALRRHADIAFMAEGFALVRIGQVDFDHRHGDALDRVMQSDRGVGQAARIDDDGMGALRMGLLQPVNQMAFMVRLAKIDRHMGAGGGVVHPLGNVVQRVIAIDFWLAGAQHVEIGSVEHIDFTHVGHGDPLACCDRGKAAPICGTILSPSCLA